MLVEDTAIPEVKCIVPRVFEDTRGWFSESWNARTFAEAGIAAEFVQDNQSLSRRVHTLRGLHFQTAPHAQGKLVRCIAGRMRDIAVDLRRGSPTYGRHVAVELSAENHVQLWIPPGFAHGFVTLEPDTRIFYKVTDYYAPECDAGVAWDDPDLAVDWGVPAEEVSMSDRDRALPRLAELPVLFPHGLV